MLPDNRRILPVEATRMTQPNDAEQGIPEEASTETPPASNEEATGPESYASFIEQGLQEAIGKGLAPEPEVEPEAQPPTEGDESVSADDGQGDSVEPPPAAAAESPEEAMARWISKVTANPKSINEIPARHHPAIVERAILAERALQEQAALMAYRQGMTDGSTQVQNDSRIAAAVAEVDEVKAADPAAYVEWRDEYPDRAQAYDQAKSAKSTPGNANGTSPVAEMSAAFEPLIAKLSEYPDAYARIQAKAAANRQLYLQTPAGFAQLSIDVAEEIASDRVKQKPVDPDQKAIEARQRAAAERKAVPRPDTSDGVGGQGSALSNDPRELLAQGWRESRAAMLAKN